MKLIDAIISRDNCPRSEAVILIKEMRARVSEGEDPEEVLYDEGFEPDYIFDLL